MGTIEERLCGKGIELPTKLKPGEGLVSVVEDGNLLYISGQGPFDNEGNLLYVGQVGGELSIEEGYDAARAAGIQLIRVLKDHIGSLDRVDRIVKALGFINSASDFHEQPKVLNGFSDLMIEVFGARGQHARSAVGTLNLPNNQPVEIEMIVRVRA
jgi:enamine deaminase RidA (YjgF/YER057c/UK114 family)